MKKIMVLLAITFSGFAWASIENSSFADRHNQAIIRAIENHCGLYGQMRVLFSEQVERQVDQGITDIYYSTKLLVVQEIDQGQFDEHVVDIKSVFYSMYDHNAKNWGVYTVESVNCSLN